MSDAHAQAVDEEIAQLLLRIRVLRRMAEAKWLSARQQRDIRNGIQELTRAMDRVNGVVEIHIHGGNRCPNCNHAIF